MKKIAKIFLVLLFGIMFITSTITVIMSNAYAESVNLVRSQLSEEDVANCEIMVVSELWHVPIRVELEHDSVTDQIVKTQSTDPNASLLFEKRPEAFIFMTETVDRHRLQLILDYKDKEVQEKREIFYRIYSNSVPVEEGTWIHEGGTYCKVFDFFAKEPPIVYDELFFEEKYDEIHGKRLSTIIDNQEQSKGFNVIMGFFAICSSIVGAGIGIWVWINFRDVKSTLTKPIKRLFSLITSVENIKDSNELLTRNSEMMIKKACDVIKANSDILLTESNNLVNIGSSLKDKTVDKKPDIDSTSDTVHDSTDDCVIIPKKTMREFKDIEDIEKLKSPTKSDAVKKKKNITTVTETNSSLKNFALFMSSLPKQLIDELKKDEVLPDDEKELANVLVKWNKDRLSEFYIHLHNQMINPDIEHTDKMIMQYRIAYDILRLKK